MAGRIRGSAGLGVGVLVGTLVGTLVGVDAAALVSAVGDKGYDAGVI